MFHLQTADLSLLAFVFAFVYDYHQFMIRLNRNTGE